jgi:hypothetical protein
MRPLCLFILLLAVAPTARAEETQVLDIGQLPGERSPVLLPPGERNPFARRESRIADAVGEKESEESKLRSMIQMMPVTGVVRGGDSVKALLGGIILKQGEPLPALIEEQTEHLVVGEISDKEVQIWFVESEETTEPRKITIPIDLRPRVTIRPMELPQSAEGDAPPPSQASTE